MGSAVELERLVIRLVGDNSDYAKTMKQSMRITDKATKDITNTLNRATAATRTHAGSWVDVNGRLRDASGRFIAGTRAVNMHAGAMRDLNGRLRDARGKFIEVGASVDTVNRKLGIGVGILKSYGARLKSVGAGMTSVGRRMSLGLTLPIGLLGLAAIKAASDAEETQQKFGVVFSKVAESAQDMADELDTSYGMSQAGAKDLLANTSDLLSGFGFTQKSSLELSGQIQKLAVDLASFTNFAGGSQAASEALTKALLGERESVKALGIAVLESDVKAQVALDTSAGLVFATERQAKAYATLTIMTRQSANAIGDYARSGGSFVQVMTEMKSDIADLFVQFGKLLLPVMKKVVAWVTKVVAWFKNLSERWKNTIIVVLAVVAVVGPLLIVFGMLASAIGTIISVGSVLVTIIGVIVGALSAPVVAIVAVVAAIVGLIAWLIGPKSLAKAWKTLVAVATWVWEKIKVIFTAIKDAAIEVWKKIMFIFESRGRTLRQIAEGAGRRAGEGFKKGFEDASSVDLSIKKGITNLVMGAVARAKKFVRDAMKALPAQKVGDAPDKQTIIGFAAEAKAAKLGKAIEKLSQKVAEQVATFGAAGSAVAIWRLEQRGATEAQLASIRASEAQLKMLKSGKLVEKMQEQVRVFNLAGRALEIYRLKQMGATRAQLQAAEAASKQLRALEIGRAADKVVDKMQEQVLVFGKVGRALQLFRLEQDGATKAQLSAARAADKLLTKLEKMKKLESEALVITKKHRTPLQILTEERQRLNEIFDKNLLGLEAFNAEMKEVEDRFKKDIVVKIRLEGTEAVISGSVEAVAIIEAHLRRLNAKAKGGVKLPVDPAVVARKKVADDARKRDIAAADAHREKQKHDATLIPPWLVEWNKKFVLNVDTPERRAADAVAGKLPLDDLAKWINEGGVTGSKVQRAAAASAGKLPLDDLAKWINEGGMSTVKGTAGGISGIDQTDDTLRKSLDEQEKMETTLAQIEENTRPRDAEIVLEASDLTSPGG